MRPRRAVLATATLVVLAGSTWALFQYRAFYAPPRSRLSADGQYPEMPADGQHHYLNLPLDHRHPERGTYRSFYVLSPHFKRGDPVIFFLTDGQMDLVDTQPDFGFFDGILGETSYVLLGGRGHSPTLFPEIYSQEGRLNYREAMNLYGSDQYVEDIEQVRSDLRDQGLLPAGEKIMLFGASGAGVLAQQYLSKYGDHVERAILESTGAPDIAQAEEVPYSRRFSEYNPDASALLTHILQTRAVDVPELAYVLYQAGRSSPNPRAAQATILQTVAGGGALWRFELAPQSNFFLLKRMVEAPSFVAAKVRWYELVGSDLRKYDAWRQEGLILLDEYSREVLSDWITEEKSGALVTQEFHLERSRFSGEVLVVSGTEDVVFSEKVAEKLAQAYPSGRFALFEDGHRLQKASEYYRRLRKSFLLGGFRSEEFQALYRDPRNLAGVPPP